MSALTSTVDISQAIRAAAAHERAALGHEDKYEQQMRSAGASMYHAFTLALRSAPEYAGRKIDDKAVMRIYKSSAPRKWWDEHLAAAKFVDAKGHADRDHAKRLLQWHVDPDAAKARRHQRSIAEAARRSRAVTRKTAAHAAHSGAMRGPRTEELRAIASEPDDVATVTVEDILGECNRLQAAARRVEPGHRAEALAALRNAAREIERYVP